MATVPATITLTIASVISAIKRHLSIIGKRLYSKDGKNMFSDIMLSSAEDTQILTQYINASAQDIEAVLKQVITASSYNSTTITITVTNNRGDTDFSTRIDDLSESYIVLNTTGEYLAMVHPDLAQKYQRDARQRIESLVEYVLYKNPFEESTDIAQPSASVTPYPPEEEPTPDPNTDDPETPNT